MSNQNIIARWDFPSPRHFAPSVFGIQSDMHLQEAF